MFAFRLDIANFNDQVYIVFAYFKEISDLFIGRPVFFFSFRNSSLASTATKTWPQASTETITKTETSTQT